MENKMEGVLQENPVLSVHETESLQEALGAHRQVLGAGEAYMSGEQGAGPVAAPGLRINRQKLSAQAKQIKDTLEMGTPQPIPEKLKDKYHQRAKWLEEQFKPYLETGEEIHVKRRDKPAWQSAVKKARVRTIEKPYLEAYIQEWKWIMRRLDPKNPNADNLHALRLEKA